MCFRHRVQCTAVLEPFNLWLIERMGELSFPRLSVLRVYPKGHRLANSNLRAHEVDSVVWVNLVVVGRVYKSQGQHALLLEVGLVLCQ